MAKCLCDGGKIKCSMGDGGDKPIKVLPKNMAKAAGKSIANILDFTPMLNIPAFGKCKSPVNPMVLAATAANYGVLKPMPCIPVTTPWTGGASKSKLKFLPVVTEKSKCMCIWGGQITVSDPGQKEVDFN